MEIFRIVCIVILSIEILGTFIASCTGSDDCTIGDVISLAIILIYILKS